MRQSEWLRLNARRVELIKKRITQQGLLSQSEDAELERLNQKADELVRRMMEPRLQALEESRHD